MSTLKKVKPIFNFIKKSRTPLVLCKNYELIGTDSETTVKIKDAFNLSDGLHKVATLGLVDSDRDIEGFPLCDFSGKAVDKITVLLEDIEMLIKFASDDETRPQLNSAGVNSGHLVATDGVTLHSVKLTKELKSDYVIPKTSLKILIRLMKAYGRLGVEIRLNKEFAFIENDDFGLKSRLLDREYPRWLNIVPKSFKDEIEVTSWIDFKELKCVFNKRFTSSIEIRDGEIVFKIIGCDNEYVIGKCDKGLDNIVIGFNVSYIDRVVGKNESFTLKFNNEYQPVMINDSIVMPMRV